MFNFCPIDRLALKGYVIEVVAVAIGFLADYLLTQPEKDFDAVRLALDLRIYYLSKNLLNLADTLITKKNDFRFLYAAAFNTAVAAALHPASRLPKTAHTTVNQLTAESLVYTSGVTARLLIEMPLEKQWINQHVMTHKWKLLTGSVGVLCSLIPFFGMSSPTIYWSGELLDLWRIKDKDESFRTHLLSAKANIPMQVIISKLVKVCVNASGQTLPFPDFLLDSLAAIAHRIVVDLSARYATKPKPILPITNPTSQYNASFFPKTAALYQIPILPHLNLAL